jgi:outer membrane immunogenic protein
MKKYFALAATLACVPGVAAAQDQGGKFDGVRIEGRLGYETPTLTTDGTVYKIDSAVSYGGELGFDLKAGNKVVVGPYAVYEFSSVKLCDSTFCLSEQGNLGAGARVGFVVSPTVLVYGKLGYASIRFKASDGINSASESKGGVQGALGVNVNFGQNVYGLVEFNYGDYGKLVDDVGLQRRHVAAGVGVRF